MNAKQEFIQATFKQIVIAVSITYDGEIIELKPGYSENDYVNFLELLNFEYNDGYGSQYIRGCIFCENMVWIERAEYDGSEWWRLNNYPKLESYFDKEIVLKYERSKKLKHILYED